MCLGEDPEMIRQLQAQVATLQQQLATCQSKLAECEQFRAAAATPADVQIQELRRLLAESEAKVVQLTPAPPVPKEPEVNTIMAVLHPEVYVKYVKYRSQDQRWQNQATLLRTSNASDQEWANYMYNTIYGYALDPERYIDMTFVQDLYDRWGVPQGWNGPGQPLTPVPKEVVDPNLPPPARAQFLNDQPGSKARKQLDALIEWYKTHPSSPHTPYDRPYLPNTPQEKEIYDKLKTKLKPWEVTGPFMWSAMFNFKPPWLNQGQELITQDNLTFLLGAKSARFRVPPSRYVTLAGPDAIEEMVKEMAQNRQRMQSGAPGKKDEFYDEGATIKTLGDETETYEALRARAIAGDMQEYADGMKDWIEFFKSKNNVLKAKARAETAPLWFLLNRSNKQSDWLSFTPDQRQALTNEFEAKKKLIPPDLFLYGGPKLKTKEEWLALPDIAKERIRKRVDQLSREELGELMQKKRLYNVPDIFTYSGTENIKTQEEWAALPELERTAWRDRGMRLDQPGKEQLARQKQFLLDKAAGLNPAPLTGTGFRKRYKRKKRYFY